MFLKLYQILHSHNLRQSVCVLFFCLCIGVGVSVCTCVGEFMNFISFVVVVVLHVHLVVFFLSSLSALYIIDFVLLCSKSSKEIINFSL